MLQGDPGRTSRRWTARRSCQLRANLMRSVV